MKKAFLMLVIFGAFTTMALAQTAATAPATTNSVVSTDKATTDQPVKKHKGKRAAKHAKHAKKDKAEDKKEDTTAATK